MQDKLDELHYIYKMIGNYGFCTVQELLDGYNSQKEVIDKAIDKLYSIPIETTRQEVIDIARETVHILKEVSE